MKELHELKEKLIDELKEYGKRDLSGSTLDAVDKLAHATKNLCKIIEGEDGYSNTYPYDRSYRGYSRNHDGMWRYSRDGLSDKLRELMDEAPDDRKSKIGRASCRERV